MRHGGRLQAAIEILADIESHRRPAQAALRDWALSHRFAGSTDRATIGNLVFDSLRWRASNAWRMDSDSPRALILATDVFHWRSSLSGLEGALEDDRHAPDRLSEAERGRLAASDLAGAPDWIKADVPEWTAEHFAAKF